MKDKRSITLSLFTLGGLLAIVMAWLLREVTFAPDLLINMGTSFMLVVPLFLANRALEKRIEQADARVQKMADSLEMIGKATQEALQRQRDEQADTIAMFERSPTQPSFVSMLLQAAATGAIDQAGIRVKLPGTALRLCFPAVSIADGSLRPRLEDASGALQASLVWAPNVGIADFGRSLLSSLTALNAAANLDVAALFKSCAATVRRGYARVEDGKATRYGPVVELINPQWGMAVSGVFRLDEAYGVAATDLLGGADWRAIIGKRSGVDPEQLDEMLEVGRVYFKRR